jgi:uracil-DNA glycosylase family 4
MNKKEKLKRTLIKRCNKGDAIYSYPERKKRYHYMFVLQNPGSDKRLLKKFKKALKDKNGIAKIEVHRDFFFKYRFNQKPLSLILGLLNYYFKTGITKEDFFSNVYITDYYKHEKHNNEEKIEKASDFGRYRDILKEEVEICKPSLILVFGSFAWEWFKKDFNIKEKTVTKIHGKLIENKHFYVIPLAHYSGREYSHTLRKSYIQYFKRGLKQYNRCAMG